jgi:hypothetical protein
LLLSLIWRLVWRFLSALTAARVEARRLQADKVDMPVGELFFLKFARGLVPGPKLWLPAIGEALPRGWRAVKWSLMSAEGCVDISHIHVL